jgi:putative CocE/NonD family hydrolase
MTTRTGKSARASATLAAAGFVICACIASRIAGQSAQTGSPDAAIKEVFMVPMRDGVTLKTIVYHLPSVTGRNPAAFLRTPYNQDKYEKQARQIAAAGYYAVTQDSRGRFGSNGTFPFYPGEGLDGYDTVEWIHKQPWSDGKVGMWGQSYLASVQWIIAANGTPLDAMAPTAGAADFYQNQYLGGAYLLGMARAGYSVGFYGPPQSVGKSPEWSKWFMHLPLSDLESATGYKAPWQISFMVHNRKDNYWKPFDMTREIPHLNVPAQNIVGYYDFLCRAAVTGFQMMRTRSATPFSRGNQQLIIGPWDHGTGNQKSAEVDFGPQAHVDYVAENIAWYDRFLRQPAATTTFPHVRYFSMGDGVWHQADQWPPADAVQTPFYLHSGGKANTAHGDGTLDTKSPGKSEPSDSFKADPANPVPDDPEPGKEFDDVWGPTDQRLAGERQDVLIYTTPALTKPIAFAGPIRAELYVSADTPDGDWVVRLIDVRPDGFAQPLATGIQRGSFRESNTDPTPLTPGKLYVLNVDMGHSAARILPGHTLRVQIAPSCFPLFERNTNTAEGPASARALVSTEQVWHDGARASRIWLPVVK